MSTRIRVALTVMLGAVAALAFYAHWKNGETEPAFAHDVIYEVLAFAIVAGVPLLVGRWWIALAIVGPLGFPDLLADHWSSGVRGRGREATQRREHLRVVLVRRLVGDPDGGTEGRGQALGVVARPPNSASRHRRLIGVNGVDR